MASVHLFGLNATAYAERLQNESDQLIESTRARLVEEDRLEPKERQYGLELAQKLCQGELPSNCSEDWFWVLIWLADTHLERIPLEALFSIKRFSYIEEIGLWPLLGNWKPPFPVPHSKSVPPSVGFAPCDKIISDILPALEALPEDDGYAANARQQFMEILESIEEDELDLLVIFI